jgi:hypothetical protein
MSQTLQNQILMAKSMNGIVSLSDGAGTTIENGSITTGGIDATSIYSDEYNTRGKSKMESIATIATSSTPYTIAYGTAQNIVFTGSVVQTVILPVVQTENLGATFTIIRTSAVQMIIQAPSGYTFYDENNSFSTAITLFSNTRVVTFTAINTGTSPAMWSMTYSQSPNQNLAVTISNTQNITGTKSFNLVNFNSLPSFIGTLGTVASNNFITKSIADASYTQVGTVVLLTTDQTIAGIKTFSNRVYFNGEIDCPTNAYFNNGVTFDGASAVSFNGSAIFNADVPLYTNGASAVWVDNALITRIYADGRYAQAGSVALLSANNAFTGNNSFSGTTTFTGSIIANALTITPTELGYLDGLNSGIQGQLNNRVTLNTTQSITAIKQFNNNVGVFGFFVPNVQTSTTSMRIGLDSLLYNTSSACTDNIAWGTNALKGNSANPTYNLTKQSIAIGTDAGSSLYYADGTSATQTDNNVLIGYQAGKNMFYASSQNVLIGSKCGSSNNWIQKCVFIGANIASTGPFFLSDCTIIGANSLTSVSDKSGIVCIGSGNLPVFSGNGPVCVGVNCGTSASNNNRGIWLGGNCGNNVASDLGSYFIGNNCGNDLVTGGSCCFMGNDSNCAGNSSMVNTFVFGYSANCATSDTFYVGGVNFFTGKTMDLLIANKNRILSQNSFIGSGTVNLTFQMGEHINLDTITSVVNLPLVGSNNVGARFAIYRDFTATVCAITSSNAFGLINNTGASATTYNIPAGACYVTLVAIAVQPTSGVPIVCWMVLNEDLNNEVSDIDYNITAITYDGTATSISSPLILNNGAIDFQDVKATTGTVGTLAVPLSSVYTITGTTSLTLPAITTNIEGVRLTFIKQDSNTLTISRSSTNTFRFPGSATSTTAGPIAMVGNWTIMEVVAQTAGVWNIVNQNSGVNGYYYRDEIAPASITANVTSWTNPIYETYLVNNTANITISLPLSNQVFVGLILRFRKIGTLTAQVVLNIQTGSGQAIKFAGATANLTTGTLLNASQTFASVMYISANLWAVLG